MILKLSQSSKILQVITCNWLNIKTNYKFDLLYRDVGKSQRHPSLTKDVFLDDLLAISQQQTFLKDLDENYGIKLDNEQTGVKDFHRSLIQLTRSQQEKNYLKKGIKLNPITNLVSQLISILISQKQKYKQQIWKERCYLSIYSGYACFAGYFIIKGRQKITRPQVALMFLGPATTAAIQNLFDIWKLHRIMLPSGIDHDKCVVD